MKTISKSQFKPEALRYFREVEQTREPVIITDHGRAVLKLIPYEENKLGDEDALDSLRSSILRYDKPEAPVGLEDWEALK